MKTVFFVFKQSEVGELLKSEPKTMPDGVCSCIPGIDMDPFRSDDRFRDVAVNTLESLMEKFGVSNADASKHSCETANHILAALKDEGSGGNGFGFPFRNSLANHVSLIVHNAICFETVFTKLVSEGLETAWCLGRQKKFMLVDRLDIGLFCHPELTIAPLLEHLCQAGKMDFKVMGGVSGGLLARTKHRCRQVLIECYKLWALLRRSFRFGRQGNPGKADVLFVLRAGSEYVRAKPVIESLRQRGRRVVLFVDDLIKTPDGTTTVQQNEKNDWVAAHSYTGTLDVLFQCLRFEARRLVTSRWQDAFAAKLERKVSAEAFSFLKRSRQVKATLFAASAILVEIGVFARQFRKALREIDPNMVVTLDYVDKWGGLVGEICRDSGRKCIALQNCSIEDIWYPLPICADQIVVANQMIKDVLERSGGDGARIHPVGQPYQDTMIADGNQKIERAVSEAGRTHCVKIALATQPFVQELDYNGELMSHLAHALKASGLRFEVYLKVHPRENAERYRKAGEHFDCEQIEFRVWEGSVIELLKECDLLVSRTSTCIQEAIMAGLPALAYLNKYPREISSRLDYLNTPATTVIEDTGALNEFFAMDEGVNTWGGHISRFADARESYLKRYAGSHHCEATDYVAEMFLEQLKPSSPKTN